jgi:hypothetical protein
MLVVRSQEIKTGKLEAIKNKKRTPLVVPTYSPIIFFIFIFNSRYMNWKNRRTPRTYRTWPSRSPRPGARAATAARHPSEELRWLRPPAPQPRRAAAAATALACSATSSPLVPLRLVRSRPPRRLDVGRPRTTDARAWVPRSSRPRSARRRRWRPGRRPRLLLRPLRLRPRPLPPRWPRLRPAVSAASAGWVLSWMTLPRPRRARRCDPSTGASSPRYTPQQRARLCVCVCVCVGERERERERT